MRIFKNKCCSSPSLIDGNSEYLARFMSCKSCGFVITGIHGDYYDLCKAWDDVLLATQANRNSVEELPCQELISR